MHLWHILSNELPMLVHELKWIDDVTVDGATLEPLSCLLSLLEATLQRTLEVRARFT